MKEYRFTEAEPLIVFLDAHNERILGKTLCGFYSPFLPDMNGSVSLFEPLICEMDDFCVAVWYGTTSDLHLTVGTKEEFEQTRFLREVMHMRDTVGDDPETDAVRELIHQRRIEAIEIRHFSEAFECHPCTGEMRPNGGDYFSDIRLRLDSGIAICVCGASAICDGCMELWCE